jgi:hypothetical protein
MGLFLRKLLSGLQFGFKASTHNANSSVYDDASAHHLVLAEPAVAFGFPCFVVCGAVRVWVWGDGKAVFADLRRFWGAKRALNKKSGERL